MGKKKNQKQSANTNDPDSLKNMGNEEFMKGNYETAIELYSKAIQLNDQNAIYFTNRANVRNMLEQYEEAIQDT